jgi:hypothetical protein
MRAVFLEVSEQMTVAGNSEFFLRVLKDLFILRASGLSL